MTPTAIAGAVLEQIRAHAAREKSPFADPVVVRQAQASLAGVPAAWLSNVAGRPVGAWTQLTPGEMAAAVKAAELDAVHLQALKDERRAACRDQERRKAEAAEAAARAEREAWDALRARLPVPVRVEHNWTARHLDGYEQGADHIVAQADLNAGRLRRNAGQPLCWTPSRDHELRHVGPNAGDEKRIPNCKACLRHARRLAED